MSIKIGSSNIGLTLGNQIVQSAYIGSNLIYSAVESILIDYLIVGGGGAAQAYDSNETCGAGGAGGFISGSTEFTPNVSSPNIQVGYGGPRTFGATIARGEGADGGASIFLGLTAFGGGGGGNSTGGSGVFVGPGRAGGSGGGAGASQKSTAGSQQENGGTGVAGQGFNGGGSYTAGSNASPWMAGAGGGAGGTATSASLGAFNTPGITKAWLDGNEYAGGGWAGGGASTNLVSGSGGDIKFNTTIGTEGKNGIVKVRYSGSTELFTGGNVEISGGYVYHTFLAPAQSTFTGSFGYYTLNYIG
jgi:hypothetical protein